MSAPPSIDIHPDDLLDRARLRGGALREDEQRRLDDHLRLCRACAIEHRLVADFAGEGALEAGDEARIAAAITAAIPRDARVSATSGGASSSRRWLPFAVAAAMLLVFALAYAKYRAAPDTVPPATATSAPAAPPPSLVAAPAHPVEPAAPIASVTSVTSVNTAAPTTHPVPTAPPVDSAQSAAELFARANESRRKGDAQEAARLYRALQKAHPASAEATTSRVALGRLLLDRLGDATGARAEFQLYLAQAPSGTLAEEARLGLALSAAKLGDETLERRAWEDLLAKHPQSLHAPRAKKRLSELP